MSKNISEKIDIIGTLQASGADVTTTAGIINITGADPIPVRGLISAQPIATSAGKAVEYTITSAAAIAGATTYTGSIQVLVEGINYLFPFNYTTPATAPSATVFYAAIALIIQGGITGGSLVGSVTSSAGGTVYTAPLSSGVALVNVDSTLSVAAGATTLTAAASAATNATPRVLTAGAAHGLTLGKIYSFTFSGVTGAGAADLNRTLFGIPLAATTITMLDTSNTGVVDTTAATMTVNPIGAQTWNEQLQGITNYSAANSYVGAYLQYETNADVEAGVVVNQLIFADATNNSVANVAAFVLALNNQTADIL
jgi:hypothetical protein